MTDATTTHTGSCRCGAVRIEAHAEPFWRSYCHCEDCRRQSGAPVLAFVGFREPRVIWHGEPREWRSGHAARSFCERCGSQIAYRDDRLPGEIYFVVGFMDDPEHFPPTLHAFWDRGMSFLHLEDDLPRHAGFSVKRPD